MKTKHHEKGMNVLVTGGAGFIGSHLVDRLVDEGYRVAVVDDLTNGRREYLNPKAHFYGISIASPKLSVVFAAEKPDIVFHLAAHIDARVSVQEPIHDAEINVHGSLRVLEQSLKHKVKKFVFASSGGAIYHASKKFPTPETEAPSPLTPYGVSKLAFEQYLFTAWHHFKFPYIALRYSNVYGPRQDQKGEGGVVGVFCRMLEHGQRPIIFGGGRQTRDFVYVDDVVDANMKAMRSKSAGVYHISTGKETSVNTVAALAAEAFAWTKGFGKGRSPAGDTRRSVLDPRLARRRLGWIAKTSFKDGFRKTAAWFKTRR
jgi:UDP-glucose 4-epimerase